MALVVVTAVMAALLASGCPLPQPLSETVTVDGGTVTPPRIVADSVVPSDTVVQYNADCDGGASFTIQADLIDENTDESVDVRWFVDYVANAGDPHSEPLRTTTLSPPTDATTLRTVPSYDPFDPTGLDGSVHVVELVVSNGFYAQGTEPDGTALPNRTAMPGYETQVYRWIFQKVDSGGRCE